MADTLYVCWTMDCEIVRTESPEGGPPDWDLANRAIRGYVETLTALGYRCTLFLIPRLAEVLPAVVEWAADLGADLGMHCHPQNLDLGYSAYLGELTAGEQRELLAAEQQRLARACGLEPTSFRSGNFSASDDTFPVLVALGFTQGSVSLPGRNRPDLAAQWVGAAPFAHFASAESRLQAGGLPFLEMPTTTDLDGLHTTPLGSDNGQLRIERGGALEWGPAIIEHYIAAQVEAGLPLKTVVAMTHNCYEYGNPHDERRQVLEVWADCVEKTAHHHGLKLVPATLAEIRRLANN